MVIAVPGRLALLLMVTLTARAAMAETPIVASPALRRDELRCDDDGCSLGACVTAQLVQDPASLLPVRLVPNFRDGQPEGFRLFALRPNTLPTQLGLKNGDTLVTVSGQTLHGPETLTQMADSLRKVDTITLGLLRQGQPLTRRLLLDQSARTSGEASNCPPILTAEQAVHTGSGSSPTTPPARAPSSAALLSEAKRSIRCTANRCTLRREVFNKLLEDPQLWTRSARVLPMLTDGKPVGMKLLGVRPDSILTLLGLRSGDVVRSLAGYELTSPEHALQAYTSLRNEKTVKVDITRGQTPLSLTYQLD